MSLRTSKGFTLFELMVTVAVVAVATAFAIPNFVTFMANNRVGSAANEVQNSIALARNVAVNKRLNVVLVPTSTGWELHSGTATGALIAQHVLDSRVTLTAWQGGVTTAGVNEITFQPSGYIQKTQPTPAASLDMTMKICDSGAKTERGKKVTVNWMGRITVADYPDTSTCNP